MRIIGFCFAILLVAGTATAKDSRQATCEGLKAQVDKMVDQMATNLSRKRERQAVITTLELAPVLTTLRELGCPYSGK
jgi:hypothetical protein